MNIQTAKGSTRTAGQARTGTALCAALLLAVPLMAQPSLRITAPAGGATVQPGQTVTVTVAATGSFQGVMLVGTGGLGIIASTQKKQPYEFQLPLSADLTPNRYYLTAFGYETPGNPIYSPSIAIVVERGEAPLRLRVEPARFHLLPGAKGIIFNVSGEYRDGTTADLRHSTMLSLRSDNPAIAKVAPDLFVTAGSAGATKITVAYRGLTFEVSVLVNRDGMP